MQQNDVHSVPSIPLRSVLQGRLGVFSFLLLATHITLVYSLVLPPSVRVFTNSIVCDKKTWIHSDHTELLTIYHTIKLGNLRKLHIKSTFQCATITFRHPSAHATRTKALAITNFASCNCVLPAPVLWNSLICDNCNLCNCQNISEQEVQRFL